MIAFLEEVHEDTTQMQFSLHFDCYEEKLVLERSEIYNFCNLVTSNLFKMYHDGIKD